MPTKKTSRQPAPKTGTDKLGRTIALRADGKLATGRPSAYKGREHDELIIALGKQGCGKAEMAAALGISRETLNQWTKTHPTFAEAMAMAWTACQAWWEEKGLEAIKKPPALFNTRLYKRVMVARFADYRRPKTPSASRAPASPPPSQGPSPDDYTDEELSAIIRAEAARRRRSQT